ncbi:MAG: FliA/WhiG family RNA polymerase sigma factor [Sedimentisphaerales bacterium]|nr:FliA/WhiG family RNA polymerase sigma factor [Sedimentisphaerales bacterium]
MKAASETIQNAWNEFSRKKDKHNRNLLLHHYLPIVKYTAQRISANLPSTVELDDLVSTGILGLMDAIDKFDLDRGIMFETYCAQRIRGAILDGLRKTDWIPRLVRDRARKLNRAMQKLQAYLGRIPTDQELARELKLDPEEFHRFQRDANAISLVSLQDNLGQSDREDEFQEFQILENQKSRDPFYEVQKRDLKEFATRGFSREEKLIITLYYFEEMTMKEIGRTLGISESRVCQIHSSIISRLKGHLEKACLREYLEVS